MGEKCLRWWETPCLHIWVTSTSPFTSDLAWPGHIPDPECCWHYNPPCKPTEHSCCCFLYLGRHGVLKDSSWDSDFSSGLSLATIWVSNAKRKGHGSAGTVRFLLVGTCFVSPHQLPGALSDATFTSVFPWFHSRAPAEVWSVWRLYIALAESRWLTPTCVSHLAPWKTMLETSGLRPPFLSTTPILRDNLWYLLF